MDAGGNPSNTTQPGGNTAHTSPTYVELSNLEAQRPRAGADQDDIQAPDAAHLPGYSEAIQTAKPPRYEKYKNEPPPGFSGVERKRWQYAHWIVVMTVFLGIGLGVGIYYGVVQARGDNRDDRPYYEDGEVIYPDDGSEGSNDRLVRRIVAGLVR